MPQLEFDDQAGRELEALYRTTDAVRRRGLVRAALAARPGERVLDVGCGPGFTSAELLTEVGPDGAVVAVDSSPQMLGLAAGRCAGAELLEGEATALPVADASVDAAICVQVLEYVPDVAARLAELLRVLRPGGRVVLWDIDWATVSWHSADPERMRRVLAAWDEHLAHPSLPLTLAATMRSVGFADVRMEAHPFAATGAFDPQTYGAGVAGLIARFAAGRGGVTPAEADAWLAEQHELGSRDAYAFACLQQCFSAVRPG
jgi:arsenite methyltransferase